MVAADNGRHHFGGPALHSGVIPKGSDVAIQLVVSFDLTDPLAPIENDVGVKILPLYYPFKYDCGGAEIQYAVRSDSEIEILYLSESEPDDEDVQYIQVNELPFRPMALEPLTYEQARILCFMSADGYFKPNDADREILKQLDADNLIRIGGRRDHIVNAGDIICRNPGCEYHNERVYFVSFAMIPPIRINGDDEFWYEFQGGDVEFCFGFCCYCGTVIGFNVAT